MTCVVMEKQKIEIKVSPIQDEEVPFIESTLEFHSAIDRGGGEGEWDNVHGKLLNSPGRYPM